jgi:hypothetical protein
MLAVARGHFPTFPREWPLAFSHVSDRCKNCELQTGRCGHSLRRDQPGVRVPFLALHGLTSKRPLAFFSSRPAKYSLGIPKCAR